VLSNSEEYFDLLFDVLEVDNEMVVFSAWSLLKMLPTNERVRVSIETLQGAVTAGSGVSVDWTTLLSPTTPLKLLYALQIIDGLVDSDGASPTDTQADGGAGAWRDAFVAHGGVAHLLHVLLTCNVDSWLASSLPTLCLTLILKLVFRLLPSPSSSSSAAGSGAALLSTVDPGPLVQRGLRVVRAAIASAKETSQEEDDDTGVVEATNEGAAALAKKKAAEKAAGAAGAGAAGGAGMLDDDDVVVVKGAGNKQATAAESKVRALSPNSSLHTPLWFLFPLCVLECQ
jgi:hypothetical protein